MNIEAERLKEILLQGNYATEEDIRKAEAAEASRGVSVSDFLLEEGLVTRDLLGQAVAEFFGIPYADLNSASIAPEQVLRIPEEIAKKCRAVLFAEKGNEVIIATDTPEDTLLLPDLPTVFVGKDIRFAYALSEDIDRLFVSYQKPLETRFSKIMNEGARVASGLLEEIFDDAVVFKASDIHFEPFTDFVTVRFRVDGVLHEAGRIPREHYENVLNRIKVKSGLRIDEHFSAQDGSLHYEKGGTAIDMRVSIIPTVEGEKVVSRVLSAYVEGLSLPDLGLSSETQTLLRASVKKPFGMILIAGPTGSGKTTTLYALLKLLNTPEVNITTIEDPVEYKMRGINQIQVNAQTNLTFAKGLRSIVRQDPDVILVGEIRDRETAEIAVNAALTGHLLLSTFHANDAATAVPRLLDMGIEPFLLASTLEVIVAERLVRKICDVCRQSVPMRPIDSDRNFSAVFSRYFADESVTLYRGKGCASCGQTGYKGRTAIFECIRVTPAVQDLIVRRPSAREIWRLAQTEGAISLFEDGIQKVKNGVTTVEELLRIAEMPVL